MHAGLVSHRPYADQLEELRAGWAGPWSTTADPRPPPLFSKQVVRSVPADLPAATWIVSGHTPLHQPYITTRRICCDTTGGQIGRQLTGVVLPGCRIITSHC